MKKRSFHIMFVFLLLSAMSVTAQNEAPLPTPVPKPGRWQKFWLDRVEVFKAENAKLDPAKKNIIFLGDSLTQGFNLDIYFPGISMLNRGIVSDGVANVPEAPLPWRGITHRLKESIYDCNPSHLFFLIGTNDVGRKNIPYEYWLGNYKYVIWQARKRFPEIKIILVTCPPTGLKYKKNEYLNQRLTMWNEIIRKTAQEEKCELIDLHALLVDEKGLLPDEMTGDGLHLNDLAFKKWTQEIHKILKRDGIITK